MIIYINAFTVLDLNLFHTPFKPQVKVSEDIICTVSLYRQGLEVLEQKARVLKCVCVVVELSTTPRSHPLIRLKYLFTPTQSRITELRNKTSTVKEAVKKGSVWGKLLHLCTKIWNDESFTLVYSWHTQCLLAFFKKPIYIQWNLQCGSIPSNQAVFSKYIYIWSAWSDFFLGGVG